ncbi:transposase [Candidatus Giovannonibacteria bacterium]|nr:transposase [Candidatus Giovannonibacteria bacterium]
MRVKPAIDEIYHIFNRGVEKREIFLDDLDRERFMRGLYVFNDTYPFINGNRKSNVREVGLLSKDREKLVEILAFVLMPNHYHLMVKQIAENGITEFIRKLGTGYTNYFNLRYKRVGPLFQGKYKCALIKDDKYFMYLPHYIHLNPIGINLPKMRQANVKNLNQTVSFLESYRWSSYPYYIGKNNFFEIIDNKLLKEVFETPQQYKNNIIQWLKDGNIEDLDDIALEKKAE